MDLFLPLGPDIRRLSDRLLTAIDEACPLPGRFRSGLSGDVAELSRLLTKGREEKGESYLGRPNLLSAYLRYFLPWNVYRLCRLLPALPLGLADGDAVTDIGSGPCTLAIALWISRPELRSLRLEFRCLDRTAAVMDAGKRIFAALVSGPSG
ncbi:MAG: rRNA methyltransferase, partial [Treponema sp.]|nr:rRNA methyltransferase [Treponema sp.]